MHTIDAPEIELAERLWSVSAVAKALQVTTKTVYRHIQTDNLRAVRVGPRLLRVPHAELVSFLRQTSVGTNTHNPPAGARQHSGQRLDRRYMV
jgi:excisionase family DNA binding protein